MFKKILVGLVALFIFTQTLLLFHNSNFEKGEYDRICHAIYDEKVWIDTCYLPYMQEVNTYTFARNIEIAGIVLSLGLLYFKKIHFKN